MIMDAYKEKSKNADGDVDAIIIPEYVDPELKECMICNFEKEGYNVIPCQPNMTYNYLTQKCEYGTYNGFTPPDCYSPCDHQATPTSIPEQLIECKGNYYFDTKKCEMGILETALDMNPLTKDIEGKLLESAATAVLTAGLSDSEGSELEKELVALACNDLGKNG